MTSDRIRWILHNELDAILNRNGGVNDEDKIRLSLSQYTLSKSTDNVVIIDPTHQKITHHAVLARFEKKTVITKEGELGWDQQK